MTPEEALEKRAQMERDGFCVIDDILTDDFLQELRFETEHLMEDWVMPIDFKYQGQHVTTRGEDNAIIQKLLDWPPTRRALEEMGYGDFASTGGIILLTKDPDEPALYWHQDCMTWDDPRSYSNVAPMVFLMYYMEDTSRHNGCLRVIPKSHRQRISLHETGVAHDPEINRIDNPEDLRFADFPVIAMVIIQPLRQLFVRLDNIFFTDRLDDFRDPSTSKYDRRLPKLQCLYVQRPRHISHFP